MKKKILIIGYQFPGSLESIYFQAFQSIGQDCEFLDLQETFPSFKNKLLTRAIYNRYTSFLYLRSLRKRVDQFFLASTNKYDLVVIFKGLEFPGTFLRRWKLIQKRAVWININPDDPLSMDKSSPNEYVRETLSLFDIYFIWSKQLVSQLLERGCRRVEYLPFAYDPKSHWIDSLPTRSENCDIMFFGAWDKERETILTSLSSYRLKIYGPNWDRLSKSSPLCPMTIPLHISGKELHQAVSSAKIALNILRPQNAGAHNMRTFEIPAAGGVMLTTRSGEQQELFPEGEASLMYAGDAELRVSVKRLLADESLRERLRVRAHELVRPHTYLSRAKHVFEVLGF